MSVFSKSARLSSLVLLGAAYLSGCATPMSSVPTYDERYKVSVAETFERLEIYIRPEGMNLSARDRSAMQQFINLYGAEGQGGLYMNVPQNMSSAPSTAQAQAEIRRLLAQSGLGGASVQTGQYAAPLGAPAPLVLSYRRLATVPIDCGFNTNALQSFNNQPYDNFGCAAQANLAQMIGDPRQMLEPYAMTPPDNTRRTLTTESWQTGSVTTSGIPQGQDQSVGE